MAQVTNVKTVKTKEQNGVLVEYLVENYGQSADFFVPDGAILDGQIDSRIGYEVIYKKHWIPMQRKDFQGYRRKTLETVERLLLMRDIEMEE